MVVQHLHTVCVGSSSLSITTMRWWRNGIRVGLRNQILRVRISPSAPVFCLVSLMVELCLYTAVTVVRFHHKAPVLKWWDAWVVQRNGLQNRKIIGSNPILTSKETWQSPVYCTCLENRRLEMVREFESHRFRQYKESWQSGYCSSLLNCRSEMGA